jgi:hypothetical protein
VDSLDPSTTYYWSVRGVNAVGRGPFAVAPFSFTTIVSIPAAVTLTSPQNGAADVETTPTLTWQAEPSADKYDIEVATSDDFSSLIDSGSDLAVTQFATKALANGTVHFWRVRGKNAAGLGAWSTTAPHCPLYW